MFIDRLPHFLGQHLPGKVCVHNIVMTRFESTLFRIFNAIHSSRPLNCKFQSIVSNCSILVNRKLLTRCLYNAKPKMLNAHIWFIGRIYRHPMLNEHVLNINPYNSKWNSLELCNICIVDGNTALG